MELFQGNDDVMGCVSNGSGHVVAFSAWNKVHAAPDLYDDPVRNYFLSFILFIYGTKFHMIFPLFFLPALTDQS